MHGHDIASDSRLCTPTHTGHRDWFGCPGVTAATDLLNVREKLPHGREEQTECEQNSKTEDEDRMRAAWRKREREKKRGQSDQAWPNKKDNQMLPI